MKTEFQIIDKLEGLKSIVADIEREKICAIDLEGDSLFHFKEKVCLLQFATPSFNVIIDPLKINDLSSLKPFFANHDIIKVFHGADYDIRSLYRDFGIEINNLFDTELACRFLGFKQTGLDTVLRKLFDVKLEKKYQKKNWSQRPLPYLMMEYAVMDVAFLISLFETLKEKLIEKNRFQWIIEESFLLSKVRPDNLHNKPLFLKFKGAGTLDSRTLAVLEALLIFRRKTAEKKDKPPFKILGNKTLIKIANAKPQNKTDLIKSRALRKKEFYYSTAIIDAVSKAMGIPEDHLPEYPRKKKRPINKLVESRLKKLKDWRENLAASLDIEAGLVCNKALMTSLATHCPLKLKDLEEIKGIKEWQKKEWGDDVIRVLETVK